MDNGRGRWVMVGDGVRLQGTTIEDKRRPGTVGNCR